MTEHTQPLHSGASYQDAAQRTRSFINSPLRLGTMIGAITAVIALLALLQSDIIGSIGWWILAALVLVFIATIIYSGKVGPATKDTRPPFFAEPMRENPNDISWASPMGFLIIFPGAWIIASVTEAIPSTFAACLVAIVLSAIAATCAILPRQFGFLPRAAQLPDNFAERCPYPTDSPEARILAALFTARLRDDYVFFADQLPYFALLDDDTASAALRQLAADKRITITNHNSALTEKGRARKFVQLTDTALAS
ncbi:MAG: hypothetical protein Q4E11_05955 [Corynebacterium sp.]|uniref:hypothetical protein n=1 Tax=Corynebacterium sp. TaxID=1720 RepID=UPI0026DBD850|nr:hypothetical protein [Corynebacterium sp.]MDO5030112.1 hypothetical protein [Corynebacterium sp.]